jgi:hypothetical protein
MAVAENVTTAPLPDVASAVVRPGTETVGAVLSRTVTSNVPGTEVFPAASVAQQETWVVPSGKTEPEAGLQTELGDGSIVSCGVTEKVTVAPLVDVASTGKDAGTVMVGGVWSWTFTSKLAGEDVLLVGVAWSLAVQVTVVVPTGNIVPAGFLLHETVGEESTVSVALTKNEMKAPLAPAAAAVMFPGTERTGAVVSWTLTVKVFAPEVLPE